MQEGIFGRLFVFYSFQGCRGGFVRSYNWHDCGLNFTHRDSVLHSSAHYGTSIIGRLLTTKTLGFRCVTSPAGVQSDAGAEEE